MVGGFHHLDGGGGMGCQVRGQTLLERRGTAIGDVETRRGRLGGEVAHRAPDEDELLAVIRATPGPRVGLDEEHGRGRRIGTGERANDAGQLVSEGEDVATHQRRPARTNSSGPRERSIIRTAAAGSARSSTAPRSTSPISGATRTAVRR